MKRLILFVIGLMFMFTPQVFAGGHTVEPNVGGGYIIHNYNSGDTAVAETNGDDGYVISDFGNGDTADVEPDGNGGYIISDYSNGDITTVTPNEWINISPLLLQGVLYFLLGKMNK